MMLKKGDKKLIKAWAFYDWANSVYSLVISTAIFPIYYSNLTETFTNTAGKISFLGTLWNPTTLYDYVLAFSFLLVAIMSPILSGIADYTGNKLKFLKVFCLLGAISVISLFFFKNEETLWVGLLFTILASIGFWGSIVFYNAYLPEVAYPEQQDKVSAKGFIYGYTGSIILLILCLLLIQKPNWFGIESVGLAT
ncbi:MAG TPA: MFS transporter, partial [Flavobacteriaceae bacterium]|nr:MFS transporter [Flavobacteriaceae bacterium]